MKKLLALFVIAILVNSCKKYEEGPSLSFRKKEQRVEGNWKVKTYIVNGTDETSVFDSIKWSFTKDGILVFTYNWVASIHTWEFQSNKEKIRIVLSPDVYDYKIKELKNKELKFQGINFNATEELLLIPFDTR